MKLAYNIERSGSIIANSTQKSFSVFLMNRDAFYWSMRLVIINLKSANVISATYIKEPISSSVRQAG